MAYEVGQVLFLILSKKQHVVPVQVVEQVTRRSLDGEETSYSVRIPGRADLHNLHELKADVYVSLEAVQAKLQDNAIHAIGKIVNSAGNLAAKHFNISQGDILVPETTQSDDSYGAVKVDLGDGTLANIKLPDVQVTG